jgi:hypothetical protein
MQELTAEFFDQSGNNWIEHCLNELNINTELAEKRVKARLEKLF